MEQIKADLGDLMGFEHTWNIPEKKKKTWSLVQDRLVDIAFLDAVVLG